MGPLSPGSVFADRFEIDRTVGSGGMGIVYRARDRATGALVALKLLLAGSLGPDESERFSRETQLLSELRHPRIVSYIAHGQTPDGQRFLAMEWLDGEDLGVRLARGPLPLDECVLLLEHVAEALVASHQHNVVHRDLKPSNLYLPGRMVERVKLIDFGIARRLDSSSPMTQTGVVLGTPDYMAPEQARGTRGITPAADIFSLGCILYHCLTGNPPFVADHIAAVLMRVLFEDPQPVEARRPGLPPALLGLLQKMLVKDPAQRLADGAALHSAVLALGLSGQGADGLAQTVVFLPDRPDHPHRPPRSGFADSDHGLLSVVIAAPWSATQGAEESARLESTQQQSLVAELHALGVRAEFLLNHTLIINVSQTGSARDQVALAAHAGLLVKGRWPSALVSLATGRGTLQGHTAVGKVVHRAERFRSEHGPAATPRSDGIWLDELSARLLDGHFTLAPQTGGVLLLGEDPAPDADRKVFGKPTPCVGREVELGILEAQRAACTEDSEARVVLVTAPPGTGKSRLLREFLRKVVQREGSLTIFQGRGELATAGAPYALLSQLLRALCGLAAGTPLDVQRSRFAARVGRNLPKESRQQVVEFIGELCGLSFPAEKNGLLAEARTDPRAMHEQVRDSFVKWLSAECAQATLLVILDDLHWGDAFSISVFEAALRELRAAPLLVLALARPEVRETFPKLWRGQNLQEIALKPLGRKACERLAQHVLGKQAPIEQVARIVQQSAGNPLFLEELIRSAAEQHSQEGTETVMAMLQARIGRFEPGVRHTLRAASVFGQSFWRGGVAELLGSTADSHKLDFWLSALVKAEMIETHANSRLAGDSEYAFRHALVRDAAYELLSESELTVGHRLAAHYLERALEPEALVLAEHSRRGGEPDRAIAFYLQASEKEARMGALQEARQHSGQAQLLVGTLPDSPLRRRLHIDILLRLVQLTLRTELPHDNLARLGEAQGLLSSLSGEADSQHSDERRNAWIDFLYGRVFHYQGSVTEALRFYHRVLPAAESLGDEQILATASMYLGAALMLQGKIGQCQPFLERSAALEDRLDSADERIRALGYYAMSLVGMGRYKDGMALHEQALAYAAKSARPALLTISHLHLCISTAVCGDFSTLLTRAQLGMAHAQKSGEKLYHHSMLSLLGWAHSFHGNFQEALTCRAEARAVEQELGGQILLSDWFAAADAESTLRAGDIPLVLKLVEEAAPKWRREQRFLALSLAEQIWGLALGHQAPAEVTQADAHLQRALELMEFTRLVLPATRLRLEWAQLCRHRGSTEQAETLRAQAVAQLEVSGCAHLIEKIERAAVSMFFSARSGGSGPISANR